MQELEWKYHGKFLDPRMDQLVEQSSLIVIGRMTLEGKQATEYSTGDARIPVTWWLTVRFTPREVLLGRCSAELFIRGRSRPRHPDPTVEDRFWFQWLEDERMEVIVFLSENNSEILHIESLSASQITEAGIRGIVDEKRARGRLSRP